MSDRMNATAKDHLFGNLETLKILAAKLPKSDLKQDIERRVKAAQSWKPLIFSKEPADV